MSYESFLRIPGSYCLVIDILREIKSFIQRLIYFNISDSFHVLTFTFFG